MKLLLYQCTIIVLAHSVTVATRSTYTQLFQQDSMGTGQILSHQNHTECPSVWFKYSQTTQDCQCIHFKPVSLICDDEYAYVDSPRILTYNSNKQIISSVKMRHKYLPGYNNMTKEGYTLLPNNISELNGYMCGPLNRKGYLCSECISGFGPAMSSESTLCANKCYLCRDAWYDVLIYLSLRFIPITVFYLFVIVFQVRLTSAPMTCFIMYSQLIVMAFYEECGLEHTKTAFSQVKFSDTDGTLRTGTKILLNLYGIFNLDFFRYVLPQFCISSHLKPIHIFFLDYISAFYSFLLIFLTWICVELHGRNFRPVVCLWRPFHRCFVGIRRGWNTKSDLVDVFASFFLLSYSKIMYQIVLTFDAEEINSYSLSDGHVSRGYVFTADVSIVMFKSRNFFFIFSICFTVVLSLLFIIFPILLLFFYPTKTFRRLLSKCTSSRFRIILNIFIEKFQNCYKDGLDEVKDMRSFSGIYFLLRIMIYLAEAISRITLEFDPTLARGFVFSVTALVIALSRPYKKSYMNIMDSILLSHMATLCYIISSSSNNKPRFFLPVMQIIIFLPFMAFFLLTIYRIAHGICKKYFQCSSLQCLTCLNIARVKLSGIFNSPNITKPMTTYGAIN